MAGTGPVVGIDLGTTNTVVAAVQGGQATSLGDETGQKLVPSVVSFHPNGTVLVGKPAKERRLVDARNTIYSIKRLIGRSWDSEEVRRARSRFPFEMREGPGQAALVVARGETYTLPEISAFVLRRAKAVAEAALGTPVERAVITVPANFNDLQRAATKVAGRVAGLEVLRILNEPTAAALAYGYGRGTSERLAVYDFGGGTFDVTLLDLSDNVFEVLATAGNTFLGGDDVDLAIAEQMAEEFLAQHRYDARTDPQAFERLRIAAEILKVKLSTEFQASIEVPEVAHGPGGKPLGLTFALSRRELEQMILPLVDQTFDTCREALGIARMQATDFDHVLLVGGSTRIPLVRSRVEEFFKKSALGHISPDEVVAIGAGIQASALAGAESRRGSVPRPPKPASRGTDPNIQAGTGKRRGTLPPGQRPSSPMIFPDPTTEPYGGRPRMQTSPGLNPEDEAQPVARPGAPIIAPPPGSLPGSRPPVTADQAALPRERFATDRFGTPGSAPPDTVAGLGPRARVPTGAGLGPAADQARRSTREGTLMSAAEAAQKATRAAEEASRSETGRRKLPSMTDAGVALPLVGMEDSHLDDATHRSEAVSERLAQQSASDEPTAEFALTPELASELGLERPAPPPAAAEPERPVAPSRAVATTLTSESGRAAPPPAPVRPAPALGAALRGGLAIPGAPTPPKRTEESVPAFVLSDGDLQEESVAIPTGQLRQMSSPASTDEVTEVHRRIPTQPRVQIDESSLPIPEAPFGEDETTTTAQRAAPRPAAGQPARTTGATWGSSGGGTAPIPVPPLPAPVTAPMHAIPEPLPLEPAAPPWGAAPAAAAAAVAPAPATQPYAAPAPPLLVDVTPLSLAVETVSGYCDTIIGRNTPVPCERSRAFVTAMDNQTSVRVRVSQGESQRFGENTLLGELELSGLRAAPRGQVSIEVKFVLDTDGILNVSARDVATGRAAEARVRLVGMPDAAQVQQMMARHQAYSTGP
jgi:molecular chaperone DnaK